MKTTLMLLFITIAFTSCNEDEITTNDAQSCYRVVSKIGTKIIDDALIDKTDEEVFNVKYRIVLQETVSERFIVFTKKYLNTDALPKEGEVLCGVEEVNKYFRIDLFKIIEENNNALN